MKVLISFGTADLQLVDELEAVLARDDIELQRDQTLMNGTASADELRRQLQNLAAWIVVLGRPVGGSSWITQDVVKLLRLGDVMVIPLHLDGHDENPAYSVIADRPGVSVPDIGTRRAAELIVRTLGRAGTPRSIQPIDTDDSAHQIKASGVRYRRDDEFDWSSKEDLDEDHRYRLISQLISDFPAPSDAVPLLRRVGYPLARLPASVAPSTFWNTVAQDLDSGVSALGTPFLRLLDAAIHTYRANPTLRALAVRYGVLVPTDGQSDRGVQVLVSTGGAEHEAQLQEAAENSLRNLGLEPAEQWRTPHAVLYKVKSLRADDVASIVADQPGLATAIVVSPSDPDYLIAQIVVNGPDLRRFRLTDVPAARTGHDVYDALAEFYPDAFADAHLHTEGWPLGIVVDWQDANGNWTRLDPDQTLDEAGVEDGDNLRVGYQANAGCFSSGSLVLLADGSTKPISDVTRGDVVVASSHYLDRRVEAPVLDVVRYERARCLTINRRLTLTPSHRLLVNNRWKQAGRIRLGDYLVGSDGAPVVVFALETSEEVQPVHLPVLHPKYGGFFVEHLLVQNMVDFDTYEAFRRSASEPLLRELAVDHLSSLKALG